MNIVELVDKAHSNAIAKGWWKKERTYGELIALVHSEVSEALEDIRAGKQPNKVWYEYKNEDGSIDKVSGFIRNGVLGKPCGVPSELADVCIRIFDIAGKYGWGKELSVNIEDMAKGELKEHWVNASITEKLNMLHYELSMSWGERVDGKIKDSVWEISNAIDSCRLIAEHHGIDLIKAITEKMEYNATRSERHGGKVL